jgi:hypothetical protein
MSGLGILALCVFSAFIGFCAGAIVARGKVDL